MNTLANCNQPFSKLLWHHYISKTFQIIKLNGQLTVPFNRCNWIHSIPANATKTFEQWTFRRVRRKTYIHTNICDKLNELSNLFYWICIIRLGYGAVALITIMFRWRMYMHAATKVFDPLANRIFSIWCEQTALFLEHIVSACVRISFYQSMKNI